MFGNTPNTPDAPEKGTQVTFNEVWRFLPRTVEDTAKQKEQTEVSPVFLTDLEIPVSLFLHDVEKPAREVFAEQGKIISVSRSWFQGCATFEITVCLMGRFDFVFEGRDEKVTSPPLWKRKDSSPIQYYSLVYR